MTSLVRKSAPIVALYWLLNRLLTCWFIRDVLPTLCGRASTISVRRPYAYEYEGRARQKSSTSHAPRVSENDDLVFEGDANKQVSNQSRARADQGKSRTLRRTFRLEAILSREVERVERQEVGEVRSRTDGEGGGGEAEGLDCVSG
jgi:hypothetical protein